MESRMVSTNLALQTCGCTTSSELSTGLVLASVSCGTLSTGVRNLALAVKQAPLFVVDMDTTASRLWP